MLSKSYRKLAMLSCMLVAGGLLYGCGGGGGAAGGGGVTNPNTVSVVGQKSTVDPTNIQADVVAVAINSPPVITFRLLDENGNPLDPNVVIKNGGSVRFTIGQLQADGYFKNYIKASTAGQPSYDSGGTFATVGTGLYTYTFKTDITDSTKTLGGLVYDATKTHTVAAQIQRTSDGSGQAVNPFFTFRPDGGTVTETREVVASSNCFACHGFLRLHGGGRREIALCVLCHYPGVVDPETGNSLDFKSLAHKIHMGAALPSNVAINASTDPFVKNGSGFSIIGFNSSLNSYKTVAYPEFSNDSKINRTPADCFKCHQLGKDVFGRTFGKDVDKYRQNPTMDKCLTCHDDYSFDTGVTSITVKNGVVPFTFNAKQHSGGNVSDPTRTDASKCAGCHASGVVGVDEYNNPTSITGAHTVLEKSATKNTGVNMKIVSVLNGKSGSAPAITFTLKDNSGATIPFTNNSFAFRIAYIPAGKADYANETLPSASTHSGQPIAGATLSATNTTANGDGSFTFTFPANLTIPAGLTGTGVITLDGRRGDVAVNTPHKGNLTNLRLSGLPDQYFFDMATGTQVTDLAKQRRKVVDNAKCLKCHGLLRGHGGSRIAVEDCVTCHNPNAVAAGNNPTTNNEAFDFKYMIHKIHTGEETQAIVPYFGDAFKEVRYPGVKGNCLACHVTDTYILPLNSGIIFTSLSSASRTAASSTNPIANNSSLDKKLGSYASSCMSCHDNPTFQTEHLEPMGGNEICTNCHGANAIHAVQTVHPIK